MVTAACLFSHWFIHSMSVCESAGWLCQCLMCLESQCCISDCGTRPCCMEIDGKGVGEGAEHISCIPLRCLLSPSSPSLLELRSESASRPACSRLPLYTPDTLSLSLCYSLSLPLSVTLSQSKAGFSVSSWSLLQSSFIISLMLSLFSSFFFFLNVYFFFLELDFSAADVTADIIRSDATKVHKRAERMEEKF